MRTRARRRHRSSLARQLDITTSNAATTTNDTRAGKDKMALDVPTDGGDEQVKELVKTVGEKLTISDGDDSLVASSSPLPPPDTSNNTITNTIVCDAWYGLPKQKRPRKERVNAVARQLCNFESWSSSCKNNATNTTSCDKCKVVLVGGESDVKVIGERLEKLRIDNDEKKGNIDDNCCRVQICPDATVESECKVIRSDADTDGVDNTDDSYPAEHAVYLSPDSDAVLDPRKPPPRIVVVGMLIDRRVQRNRSLLRAQKINTSVARLPMNELRVEGLENSEALNVDTVLELMVRWWGGVDRLRQQQKEEGCEGDNNTGDALRICFLDAATSAMVSHEDRHPNRAIHGSGT